MTLAVTQRIFPLAVHLPQLVWLRALEAARRRTMHVLADQTVTLQDPMDGSHRQRNPLFFLQQHPQLFRPPTHLLAQGHDPLLLPGFGPAWTLVRPSAALGYPRQAAGLPVALPPEITCRTRNPELATQRCHWLLAASRSNHELHSLLAHIRRLPPHRL